MSEPVWRSGGCHCGGVRFEAALSPPVEAQTCSCTICSKTGFIHMIVPQSRFRITRGEGTLVQYVFNSGVAKHLFCPVCGVKAFYRPRSNPDGWSVNARCLDEAIPLNLTEFDGANWEANAASLAHLSHEPS